MAQVVETPLMKQYNEIKKQYPDAILLFRVGDFYETFCQDAIKASEILGITLTRRANGAAQYVELAGFPHHALDTYLPKLVRSGHRVAICDQLEDPKMAKNIVKRGITEVVTPGVNTNENALEVKENNFLASVYIANDDKKHQHIGLSFLDISTGEFLVGQGNEKYIEKMLSSFAPKEIIYEEGKKEEVKSFVLGKYFFQHMPDWIYNDDSANSRLKKLFEVTNLKGFGVEKYPYGIVAAGAILYYLDQTKHEQIGHITSLSRIEEERYVWLDDFTIHNLELVSTMLNGGKCLYDVIDKTVTPMGSRLLRRWILFPLKDKNVIVNRLAVVTEMFKNVAMKRSLQSLLSQIGDMERVVSKVAVGRVTPRDLLQLNIALNAVCKIKEILAQASDCEQLTKISSRLNDCEELRKKISQMLDENAPAMLSKGGVIAAGVNAELDELRNLASNSKEYLNELQIRESQRTDIPSLKISYNNVFGYYIEVRNTHKDKVPPEWIRKQTLVSAERYITEELKVYEEKILNSQERIAAIEGDLFAKLVAFTLQFVQHIQVDCNEISQLDCLVGFAQISGENKYICPVIESDDVIDIKSGRHPVIEKQLPLDEPYIPNDVYLDNARQQIMMITGPNMSGKSALLRQTALIVLMAQIGCFVPAQSARIGIVDKIFTRVGANDNLSVGDSTFMVEMNEAASILNNVTSKSLVLFDELGRGTSTYDGISIAWAIVEWLHQNGTSQPKTLFATHYHELNEMEKSFKRVKNFNVSIKEVGNKVIFLRKLVPGGSEHSFGIHVAKMAGMPKSITDKAEKILKQLESDNSKSVNMPAVSTSNAGMQLSFFQLDDPVLSAIRDEISSADIDNLTPMEALMKLNEIKKIITGK